MADSDDVPPLEDMSELLQQVDAIKEYKKSQSSTGATPIQKHKTQASGNTNLTAPKKVEEKTLPKKVEEETSISAASTKKKDFGGMKKGFLFGGSSANKASTAKVNKNNSTSSDIPYIKPKSSQEEELKMPEVQQALKAGEAFVQNKDWITGDLLGKVQKNEKIIKRMADPQFMQAITEFQSNPDGAMLKYKDNKKVQEFLQEFCGIMGNHFTKMADAADAQQPQQQIAEIATQNPDRGAEISVRCSTDTKQPTAADEERMREILADPEVHGILMDPRIQKLIETLRTDPDKAQRVLTAADEDFQQKIRKLTQVGLLQFQSS